MPSNPPEKVLHDSDPRDPGYTSDEATDADSDGEPPAQNESGKSER